MHLCVYLYMYQTRMLIVKYDIQEINKTATLNVNYYMKSSLSIDTTIKMWSYTAALGLIQEPFLTCSTNPWYLQSIYSKNNLLSIENQWRVKFS